MPIPNRHQTTDYSHERYVENADANRIDDRRILLNQEELAYALNLSVSTVWNLRKAGRLPVPVIISRRRLWDRRDIETWISDGMPSSDQSHQNSQ